LAEKKKITLEFINQIDRDTMIQTDMKMYKQILVNLISNAIIGFTQYLLAYEELNEEQQEIVENIESSAQYLLSMINDILDIAKIEAGKMDPNFERVAILPLIQNSIDMLRPLAEKKKITFELKRSRDVLFSNHHYKKE